MALAYLPSHRPRNQELQTKIRSPPALTLYIGYAQVSCRKSPRAIFWPFAFGGAKMYVNQSTKFNDLAKYTYVGMKVKKGRWTKQTHDCE